MINAGAIKVFKVETDVSCPERVRDTAQNWWYLFCFVVCFLLSSYQVIFIF